MGVVREVIGVGLGGRRGGGRRERRERWAGRQRIGLCKRVRRLVESQLSEQGWEMRAGWLVDFITLLLFCLVQSEE